MGDRSYVCLDSEGELDTDIDVTGYRHVSDQN